MITAFDLMNAMNRSYGIGAAVEDDATAPSLMSRAIARIRGGSTSSRAK